MTAPTILSITRCDSGIVESASIQSLNREDAKRLIDERWWSESDLVELLCDPEDEPDRHWKWRQLVSVHQNKPYFRAVSVRSADAEVQAAMLFRVDALSALERGARAVFVDRLATAPRNRDYLTSRPLFRGSGTGLLTYAVAMSYSLGFQGRVNLIVVASESFYRDCGFMETSVESDDGPLLELPAANAFALLQTRGVL